MMSIKKRATGVLHYALEPDRLQKLLIAPAHAQADLIRKIKDEMDHIATHSVLEALRSDKRE